MTKQTITEILSKNEKDTIVEEVLDILEANDGRPYPEKREMILEYLENMAAKEMQNYTAAERVSNMEADAFDVSEPIGCTGGDIVLRKVEPADRERFLALQREYSIMKSMLKEEIFCNEIWREHLDSKAIMLSILRNGCYIGYCGIKNINEDPWEIAIEIMPEWTRKGIGYSAISGMLDEFHRRFGISKFRVRIDPVNHSSQRLFEKLGAVPNGISELWIHDKEALEKCEEENLHIIDEQLITVAQKFGVAPRKLLSHVLEYILIWNKR